MRKKYLMLYSQAERESILSKYLDDYPQEVIRKLHQEEFMDINHEKGEGVVAWALYELGDTEFYSFIDGDSYDNYLFNELQQYVLDRVNNCYDNDRESIEETVEKWDKFISKEGKDIIFRFATLVLIKASNSNTIKNILEKEGEELPENIKIEENSIISKEILEGGRTVNRLYVKVVLKVKILGSTKDFLVTIYQSMLDESNNPIEIVDNVDEWEAPIKDIKII
jgi:hypothetical protein